MKLNGYEMEFLATSLVTAVTNMSFATFRSLVFISLVCVLL